MQGEVVAMVTDVAEFIGAALGLNLLFGMPMLPAGLITFTVLHMRYLYDKLGAHRRLEAINRARALGLLAPVPQRA